MKHSFIYKHFVILLFAAVALGSCSKDTRDINMNITAVNDFYAPNDNLVVKLEPATAASVGFEWGQAKAEDGSLVMYEVAFDKENGDFSKPIYRITSDGNGVQNKLTLSHKDLNRIADFAGIKSLETGKLRWTVLASKGTNVKKSDISRIIEVARPAGFAEIPTEVFITGDATEAGAAIASAIKLKQKAPGVFEIYTKLKGGTYNFVNKTGVNSISYQVQGTFIKIGGAVASPTTTEQVYRIELDFNNAAVKLMKVKGIGFWFAPKNEIQAIFEYAGAGTYTAKNVPIEFKQEGWGRDERYKFRMLLLNSDNVEVVEDWGSKNQDNSRPTAATPEAWYYIYKQGVTQWDYCFKFSGLADKAKVDFILNFKPDKDYNHQVIIK